MKWAYRTHGTFVDSRDMRICIFVLRVTFEYAQNTTFVSYD